MGGVLAGRPHGIQGVSPVLEVPFLTDERVDLAGFDRVVSHTLGLGVGSVMFPGFASEFHKLSDAERSDLLDVLLARTRASQALAIVAVQAHATKLACAAAVDAVERGADAINLLPPHQFAPSPLAVRAHVTAVLRAVGDTPVVLQYAPAQTGTSLDAATIASIAAEHENLAAVKVESAPPGRLIAALQAASPAVPALVGYAGLQLPDALRRGAVGVQPGCSFTELYLQVWELWHSGDQAAAVALHTRMVPYLAYWMQSVELIVAAEKRISQLRGIIDSDACRAPAWALDAEELARVDAFVAEFDLGPVG